MTERQIGRVEGIYVTPVAGEQMQPVTRVRAVAAWGLEGDRYAAGAGSWSARAGGGRHITLIAREDLDAVAQSSGIRLDPAASRRNVLTSGVDLVALMGRQFRVGNVLCAGIRLCEPCAYLESKTHPGVAEAFVHRAGLRADILESGDIAVGDLITLLEAGV